MLGDELTVLIIVCDYFKITPKHLCMKTRKREIVIARHFYFHLAKKYTNKSLEKIGKIALIFGRNEPYDHATVLHGDRKTIDLCDVYPNHLNDLDSLKTIIIAHIQNGVSLKSLIPNDVDLLMLCEPLKKAS